MNGREVGGWRALAGALDGDVVLPDDSGYLDAARLFNRRFDAIRPAAIVRPLHADDVVESLALARSHGVAVSIRSGGHSYAGWSSGDDRLVIDLGRMDRIHPLAHDVVVGAGVRLGALAEVLGVDGRTVAAGTCPSVGVSGLALGGGHGLVSRAFGLTCDDILEATIVTAVGDILVCDTDRHPELFRALRGAGNGNFGVVTELRLRTHDAPRSGWAELSWPWSHAERVLERWQHWAIALPDHLWSGLRLEATCEGRWVTVSGFALGGASELATAMASLPDGATHEAAGSGEHIETARRFAGEVPVAEARPAYDVRSAFLGRPLDADGVRTAVASMDSHRDGRVDAVLALVVLGGAIDRVDRTETAFVHRGHAFIAQWEASWADDPDGGMIADGWLRRAHAALEPHASGEAYQNVPDPRLADWRRAYYGDAAPELARLKRALDPSRMFDFPHAL